MSRHTLGSSDNDTRVSPHWDSCVTRLLGAVDSCVTLLLPTDGRENRIVNPLAPECPPERTYWW